MVKPEHPFERGQLQGFLGLSRCSAMNQFSLVETVDGLGQSVVIAVTFTAHRWFNASFCKPLAVPDTGAHWLS